MIPVGGPGRLPDNLPCLACYPTPPDDQLGELTPDQMRLFAVAAAIVLFHNHPSGDPRPSADDVALTARLVDAGQVVGIDVLDHLILADQRYYSFIEAGQLPRGDP